MQLMLHPCVVLAFLVELKMVVMAREGIGSSAESLFLDRFLSNSEM